MVSRQEYLKNPCKSLSIPYWKATTMVIPDNMLILHDNDFSNEYLDKYKDERYFRLYHNLKNVNETKLDGFSILTATQNDFNTFVSIINDAYEDITITKKHIISLTKTPVYNPNLWLLVCENKTKKCIAAGIADYDTLTKEIILEWIQVLPEYRKQGIGSAIVNELLFRMKNTADFATVSGKADNKTNPEKLYRKCGFVGIDVWHILYKKDS